MSEQVDTLFLGDSIELLRSLPGDSEESTAADCASSAPPCAHRLRWATLLARVFSSDLSACATCGGRLRIIAALTDSASIRTYLEGIAAR